ARGAAPGQGGAGPSHGRAFAGAAATSAFGASGLAGSFLLAYLKGDPVEKPRVKGALGAALGFLLLSLNCVLLFLADRYYPVALVFALPFLFGGGALAVLGQPLGGDGRPAIWGKLAVGAASGFGLLVGIVLAVLLRI
ncbi:MAG TPA: hypothetical protein RMH99_19330, partial [Sandaracinaceae bacterium LLY-WYZ-13_1]|nr:hypothetical protein [Sandaracinaceae bacterium LLY-WYZ-13_1]